MKTKLTRNLMAALLGAALTTSLHAQTSAFTYQGQLTDNGSPASGIYDLQFTIYEADSGGSAVAGPLTNNAVSVSNGLFTVALDFGPGVFDGSDRWLELGVTTNGGGFATLSPRQPLTSAPYAVRAANAASANTANSVAAGNITGTINLTQLPGTVVTNGASGVNISGTFSGDGAAITNVDLFTVNTRGAIYFSSNLWGQYTEIASPAVASYPAAVTAADLNGDGWPDLVCGSHSPSSLTVLTNDGTGGFGFSASIPVSYPNDVTTADVNGDGWVDLISAGNDLALTVLTNDGSGGFVLASTPAVGGGSPLAVAAADLNGDGWVDLAAATDGFYISILTNNGMGGFVSAPSIQVGDKLTCVAAADLNEDGRPDLLTSVSRGDEGFRVLINNTNGGFDITGGWSSPSPEFVATADFNRDGRMDWIGGGGHGASLFLNNSNGGFTLSSLPGLNPLNAVRSGIAADINGDGWVDVVVGDISADQLVLLTNDGSGGFAISETLSVPSSPVSMVALDIDGDGGPDLVNVNEESASLTVWKSHIVAGTAPAFTGDGAGLTGLNATNLTGQLSQDSIPGLDASKITTGTFDSARIPDLDASKITSGTFSTAQIPDLDASKITSGTLSDARLSANVALLDRTPQAFTGTNTFAGRVGIGTTSPQASLHVVGSIIANGEVLPSGIRMPASFGADTNYVGTPGNYVAFAHSGVSEDFIGYKNNTFYMKDSPGGGDSTDPNLVVGGDVSGNSFITTSDRNAKENFNTISPADVLAKVTALPISEWNFKTDANTTHIGPMAQDFYAAFGVGPDDTHIATVDADGVALAAIQGLNQKLEAQRGQLEQKETEITELKNKNESLEARLEKLEQLLKQKLNGGAQ